MSDQKEVNLKTLNYYYFVPPMWYHYQYQVRSWPQQRPADDETITLAELLDYLEPDQHHLSYDQMLAYLKDGDSGKRKCSSSTQAQNSMSNRHKMKAVEATVGGHAGLYNPAALMNSTNPSSSATDNPVVFPGFSTAAMYSSNQEIYNPRFMPTPRLSNGSAAVNPTQNQGDLAGLYCPCQEPGCKWAK